MELLLLYLDVHGGEKTVMTLLLPARGCQVGEGVAVAMVLLDQDDPADTWNEFFFS